MRLSRLWRATSFRLALWQTFLFVVAFAAAGVLADIVVRRDELQAVDAEITAEVADLKAVYGAGGLAALRNTVAARQRDPSIWEFRIEDAAGRRLAGDLPAAGPQGWSTRRLIEGDLPDDQSEVVRALRGEVGGFGLTVGEDLGTRERTDEALLVAVLAVAAGAVALSLSVGGVLAWRALARVDEMATTMQRYGAGDVEVRARTGARAPSDLDELAAALNHMLERTTRLMTGLRQVSADIAHDLRRPLARHNERIARTLQAPASLDLYREALVSASGEVDDVLRTFQALLHIAELEAGAPGLATEPVDLGEVAGRVVAAYLPMAEEGQRTLSLAAKPQLTTRLLATPDLLAQMIANLVENALTHTPVGSHVTVAVEAEGLKLSVTDDGAGVPAEALQRIFERFTRLDASRSTPGTGLGLALSSAIAQAFDGRIYAESANPGLRVVADFSRSPHVLW
ncbi:HAMP domain-containing sensor histidine kinase [Caulobacter sp. S45]|uniref:sensor histidine kinase n=1 Tax=Caulobacter sp. S45 TaxID=1641861 RepID=UPI0015752334|nr:HAMP domain-containing sensor histidine kinase [Caulobacter sp. S45]